MPIDFRADREAHIARLLPCTVTHINLQINLQVALRVAEDTAKIEALRQATSIGRYERDELAPDLRSYHPIHSRQQAKQTHGTVKIPRHIVFYRVANDNVIEVVRLLHDAMEVQLHLPND